MIDTINAPVRAGRRWVTPAIAVTLLVLIVISTGAYLYDYRERNQPSRYDVAVFLTPDITAGQKADLQRALTGALHPVDGIRLETREQAYENFKVLYRDSPDLVRNVKPENLPESFRLTTVAKRFDCGALTPLTTVAGVDEIIVREYSRKDHPGGPVHCS